MAQKNMKKHFRTIPECHQESIRYKNRETPVPEYL